MYTATAQEPGDLVSLAPPQDQHQTFYRQPVSRSLVRCDFVIEIVAAMFNVFGADLRRSGRSDDLLCRIRQIAMYVCRVIFEMSPNEIGTGFGRDRTTVDHACRIIEDMRDDRDFDAIIHAIERVAGAGIRFAGGGSRP